MRKITDAQIQQNGVVSAPDKLQGTAQENKAVFDRLVKDVVKEAFNDLIDDLTAETAAENTGAKDSGGAASNIQAELDKRVEKVAGKGLSTNDYTTAEKEKLADLPTGNFVRTELEKRVEKEAGKGLSANDYTDADKAKLAGMPTGEKVLAKDNTAPYTPTGDYNPATKKYVNDAVIEAGAMRSFNGRSGAVMPQAGDYTAAMVGAVGSFNGRSGAVIPKAGDYTAEMVGAMPDNIDDFPTQYSEYAVKSGGVYDALTRKCNRNLLDNWYFVGGGVNGKFPINQRGATSYGGANSAAFDRWKTIRAGDIVTLESDCIKIENATQDSIIRQIIEDQPWGRTVCLSILCDNNEFAYKSVTLPQTAPSSAGNLITAPLQNGDARIGIRYNGTEPQLFCQITCRSGYFKKAKAIKLELGSQQTLAHFENGEWVLNEIPDYGEELRKCQRYYCQGLGASDTLRGEGTQVATGTVKFPIQMRDIPTVSAVRAIKISDSSAQDVTAVQVDARGFSAVIGGSFVNQAGYLIRYSASAEL